MVQGAELFTWMNLHAASLIAETFTHGIYCVLFLLCVAELMYDFYIMNQRAAPTEIHSQSQRPRRSREQPPIADLHLSHSHVLRWHHALCTHTPTDIVINRNGPRLGDAQEDVPSLVWVYQGFAGSCQRTVYHSLEYSASYPTSLQCLMGDLVMISIAFTLGNRPSQTHSLKSPRYMLYATLALLLTTSLSK